jgi:hypothetical protein
MTSRLPSAPRRALTAPLLALGLSAFASVMSGCDLGKMLNPPKPGPVINLTGTLVSPNGRPVAGARVRVHRTDAGLAKAGAAEDSALTDASGNFKLGKVVEGAYNLSATWTRNDSTWSLFRQGVTVAGQTLFGIDTLRVSGRLVLQATSGGERLTSVRCFVPGSPYFVTADAEGNCLFSGLPPGAFNITLSEPAHQTRYTGDLSVLPGLLNDAGGFTLTSLLYSPVEGQNFPLTSATVALWTFNAYDTQNRIADQGPNGFHLARSASIPLVESPNGSAASFTGDGKRFTVANNIKLTAAGTGRLTVEARVLVTAYPDSGTLDASAEIIGFNPGPRLLVTSDGRLAVNLQRRSGSAPAYAFSPKSAPGVVPLGRWVNLAFALDTTSTPKQVYAYVDGIPVQLFEASGNDPFVTPAGALSVGNDNIDNLSLKGRIDEIRITGDLALGAGVPLRAATSVPSLLSPADLATDVPPLAALSWSAVEGAAGYQLQIALNASFTARVVNDSSLTGTSDTLAKALASGFTYYWRVRARGDANAPWSPARRFTTTGSGLVAPAPHSPSAGALVSYASTYFTWSAVSGAAAYRLQVAADSTFAAPETDVLITSAARTAEGLSASSTRYWRVRAENGNGPGAWSETRRFTTTAVTDGAGPARPLLTAPADSAQAVTLTPLLRWNRAAGASVYHLQVSSDPAFSEMAVDDSSAADTARLIVPGLASGVTWYWRARARSGADRFGEWSATRKFTTRGWVPAPPEDSGGSGAGRDWTSRGTGTSTAFYALTWNDSLKLFAGVGNAGMIRTSPDGVAWSSRTSGTSEPLFGVAARQARFVAVGANGTIAISTTGGTSWSARASGTSATLTAVCAGPTRFVAVGAGGVILTSPDGEAWTSQASGTNLGLYAVAVRGNGFIAVGAGGTILVSPDGFTWKPQASGTTVTLYSVSAPVGQTLITGAGGLILGAGDGSTTWTVVGSGTTSTLYAQARIGILRIAVGANGTILTSPDGTVWTSRASGTGNALYGIAWNGTRFSAVGASGAALTSP